MRSDTRLGCCCSTKDETTPCTKAEPPHCKRTCLLTYSDSKSRFSGKPDKSTCSTCKAQKLPKSSCTRNHKGMASCNASLALPILCSPPSESGTVGTPSATASPPPDLERHCSVRPSKKSPATNIPTRLRDCLQWFFRPLPVGKTLASRAKDSSGWEKVEESYSGGNKQKKSTFLEPRPSL